MKIKYFEEVYHLDFLTDPVVSGDKLCSEGLDKDGNRYLINWVNNDNVDWEYPCDIARIP